MRHRTRRAPDGAASSLRSIALLRSSLAPLSSRAAPSSLLEGHRPTHGTVKHAQYVDVPPSHAIWHDVGRPADDQLPGSGHSPGSAHTRLLGQGFNQVHNPRRDPSGGVRTVLFDVATKGLDI